LLSWIVKLAWNEFTHDSLERVGATKKKRKRKKRKKEEEKIEYTLACSTEEY
jgi:hypothetical protein